MNVVEIKTAVKAKIAESSEVVQNRLVDELVEMEVKSRVALLRDGLATRDTVEREIAKVKPDVLTYTETGAVANSSFSKAKVEELKKAKAKLAKIDTALDKAIVNADFSQLKNLKQILEASVKEETLDEN